MTRITRIALIAAVTAVGAAPASAMQTNRLAIAESSPEESLEKSKALQAEAEALFEQPRQWRKAMKLFDRAGDLRGAEDPEAYACYMYAGRLGAAVGDWTAAGRSLRKAAEHALARGNVVDAANAYVDAAHVAVETGDRDEAVAMMKKAQLLTASPLLTDVQKTALVQRLRTSSTRG